MDERPKKWVRWNSDGKIHDHYELVTQHEDLLNELGFMISAEPDNKHFVEHFEEVQYVGSVNRIIGINNKKEYKIWVLKNYKSKF